MLFFRRWFGQPKCSSILLTISFQTYISAFVIFLNRTIGVVGIDATLEEIENFLNRHQWGTVYSFLMNSDGETIFHPRLKPSETVSHNL